MSSNQGFPQDGQASCGCPPDFVEEQREGRLDQHDDEERHRKEQGSSCRRGKRERQPVWCSALHLSSAPDIMHTARLDIGCRVAV